MSNPRAGIRFRLTAIVVVIFAAVASVASWAILHTVHDQLVDNSRTNAASVLEAYLRSVAGGGPMLATTDPATPGTFFYLDADGRLMSAGEYLETIVDLAPVDGHYRDPPSVVGTVPPHAGEAATPADLGLEPGATVGMFAISIQTELVGPVHTVDLGDASVAVAQRLRFPGGVELEVGVFASLLGVDDGMDTLRTLTWITVPVLTLIVGLITFVAVGRTLRPVHSIIQRTREISDTSLSDRVPVPDRHDDIAELATTMNEMLGRLDAAQQRQRRFVADASHELRSPVAASQAQLEVALAHPADADWERTAATVLSEQQHLGSMIDDLLALSRLDEQGAGTIAPVDLGQLVSAELARPHNQLVHVEAPAPDAERRVIVSGNASLLARAVRNLVDNADCHAATHVTITVTTCGDRAVVHVDDDGPGVPAVERERIFERFARIDQHRDRAGGGTGLGLAIVRQIAVSHGGTSSCAVSPAGGARFTLDLPAVASQIHADEGTTRPRSPANV